MCVEISNKISIFVCSITNFRMMPFLLWCFFLKFLDEWWRWYRFYLPICWRAGCFLTLSGALHCDALGNFHRTSWVDMVFFSEKKTCQRIARLFNLFDWIAEEMNWNPTPMRCTFISTAERPPPIHSGDDGFPSNLYNIFMPNMYNIHTICTHVNMDIMSNFRPGQQA